MPDISSFEKVIVTGGSGFIGQHLLRMLVAMGCHPVAITRRAQQNAIVESLKDHVRWVQMDINREPAGDFFRQERPDVLFHLAGTRRCENGMSTEVACAEMNIVATLRLLAAAGRAGVRRAIIIGSADEYGHQPGPLHEGLPLQPTGAYGISKAAATHFALAMHAARECAVIVLRPFSVYGPHQPSHMFVAEAVTCAVSGTPFRMSEGRQQRDLVFVEDVARALVAAACASAVEGRVINIGSGQPRALRDVAALIWQLSESRAPLLVGARPASVEETHDTWADIQLARRALDWEPRVDLESGLRATIRWAREQ